jgi:hypothetical protein
MRESHLRASVLESLSFNFMMDASWAASDKSNKTIQRMIVIDVPPKTSFFVKEHLIASGRRCATTSTLRQNQ